MPSGWPVAVSRQVVRWRMLMALFGLVVGLIALPVSRRLEFNRSISAMFKPDDPTIVAYRDLQESFGGNSVVMLVYQDADFMSDEGIRRNEILSMRVEQVSGVDGVLSPSVLNRAVEKVQPASLISPVPALFQENAVASGFDELFSGYTHSRDHSRVAVVAMLHPDHPPETIRQLRQIALELPAESNSSADGVRMITSAAIVGEPVLVHDGFTLIERDGARLATLTVALLSVVVVVSLADLRFVLLTSIMIAWSVVVTRAMMVWMGIHLSLVSTILTAIVTVIAVAAVLHLGVRFRIARSRGSPQQQSTTRSVIVVDAADRLNLRDRRGRIRRLARITNLAGPPVRADDRNRGCRGLRLSAVVRSRHDDVAGASIWRSTAAMATNALAAPAATLPGTFSVVDKQSEVMPGNRRHFRCHHRPGYWTCEDRNQFFEQFSSWQPPGPSL